MELDNVNMKLIGAVALGAIGGLLLGAFLWGGKSGQTALSDHLATLSKILSEIEGIDSEEAKDLRLRINNILQTFESNYAKAEK